MKPRKPKRELPVLYRPRAQRIGNEEARQRGIEQLTSAKNRVLEGMRKEYNFMDDKGITRVIEEELFPHLIRGCNVYLEMRRKKAEGTITRGETEFYLSGGFDEHMRNWENAFIRNYRGPNKEQLTGFFQEFYNELLEQLQSKPHRQLPP